MASTVVPPLRSGNVVVDDAVLDLILTAFFAWMALKGRRWWALAMTAIMVLTLLMHATMFAQPDLSPSIDVAARIGLGLLVGLTLLAGVLERWLADEPPVSPAARWRRRKAA